MVAILKINCIIVLTLVIAIGLLSVACAESQTFTVPALQTNERTITITQDQTVSGSIKVSGGSGNDVNFYVINPQGDIIKTYERSSSTSFSFSASENGVGTYTLRFDNSFSLISGKSITLDYTINDPSTMQAYVGVPFVWIIVAVIIAVLAIIAVVVVISRRNSYPGF